MTTVAVTAECRRCPWTADGDWAMVDRQADKHTRQARHVTVVTAVATQHVPVRNRAPGAAPTEGTPS